MKKIYFTLLMSVFFLFIVYADSNKEENNDKGIEHITTLLGGCNDPVQRSGNIENDTVIISSIKDTISVFVGWNYICSAPFRTECEIKEDSVFIYIIDTCETPMSCYDRCSCYYTFDFKFIQQDENKYKYKILLFDPRETDPQIIGYGTIDYVDNIIVNSNSSWSVLHYGFGTDGINRVFTQYVYFDGDSVVTDRAYKKVFSCRDELHENIMYEGLLREQDKKTYYIPVNWSEELLLYDFSLENGMTFEFQFPDASVPQLYYLYAKVDSVEINGIQKKRIQLTDLPPYDNYVSACWIENLGNLRGFLEPCIPRFGVIKELLCYSHNGELIYKNPDYSACYYDKVEDLTSVKSTIINSLAVYPNPVDNLLVISSSNVVVSQIEFTDMTGKIVYAKRLDAGEEHTIDVSAFASGLYFLHVYDANGLTSTFKIIKR